MGKGTPPERAPIEAEPAARPHVYRIVRGAQPTRSDFLSDKARGKPLRDNTAEGRRHYEGFSVWLTLPGAIRTAKKFQNLGTHIAEIELPNGASLLPFSHGGDHQTALGDPDSFFRSVVQIVPVP